MNLIRSLWRSLTPPKKLSNIPEGLKRLADKCDAACVVSTFDEHTPIVLYSNRKHKSLFGYSLKEIQGLPVSSFYTKDSKVDNPTLNILDSLQRDNFWSGEIINYSKCGKGFMVSATVFAICYEGKKYYISLKNKKRG